MGYSPSPQAMPFQLSGSRTRGTLPRRFTMDLLFLDRGPLLQDLTFNTLLSTVQEDSNMWVQ